MTLTLVFLTILALMAASGVGYVFGRSDAQRAHDRARLRDRLEGE